MARPLRLQVHDGIYHVTTRGNAGAQVFFDDADRASFLEHLEHTIERYGWRCLSYCLMTNHVHLLVRTPQPNLARAMQQLKSRYAQASLRRRALAGHVFGGRYGAVLVQRDSHLLEVFRYIALNPVRAGLCRHADHWRWGAHAALSGDVPAPPFLAVAEATGFFGGLDEYREFVGAPMAERYDGAGVVFGSETFKRSQLPSTRPSRDISIRDWGHGRPALPAILDSEGTAATIATAYRTYGYTLQAIAGELGCHYATVSRRLAVYERGMLDCKL